MADQNMTGAPCEEFKEAVCMEAGRIYDSCSDKDCIEDLRVYFTAANQAVVDQAVSIKTKDAEVVAVFLDVEPVPFNQGFYSVDMSFYIRIGLDVYPASCCVPTPVFGFSQFCKKVILYGSEGKVKTFDSTSDRCNCEPMNHPQGLPKASVQVVDPIILSCAAVDVCAPVCDPPFSLPPCLEPIGCGCYNGVTGQKRVSVSLGLFSIVWLQRNVQLMVPTYDFNVPGEANCCGGEESACDLFKKIKFPTAEFFPPRLDDLCPEE